jgi:subtilisin-like proprotein convertase family protein
MTRMIRMYLRQVVAAAVISLAAAPAAHADLAVQHDSTVVTETAGNGNGIPEPGDTVALSESVMSVDPDQTFTGVSGTLATTSTDATVGSASSAYADLVFGVPTANATPYSVALSNSMECGASLPFTLGLQTSVGATDVPFNVPTGSAGAFVSYDSTDVPRAIPDAEPTGLYSDLTIAGDGGRAKGVRVRIGKIAHTYDGDLTLWLVAPDGRTVKLVSAKGGAGDDFVDTVFDDAAASAIRSTTTAPFTGTYKPAEPLAAMDGAPLAGTWKLKVVDASSGDIGSVEAWGADIAPAVCAPQPAPPPPPPAPPHDCGKGGAQGTGKGTTKPPKSDKNCPARV